MLFLIFIISTSLAACHDWKEEEMDWRKHTHLRVDPDTHEIMNYVRNPIHCQLAPIVKQLLDIKKKEALNSSHILEPHKRQ